MIFGGEAFKDWIGEISLMKDLTRSMEMSEKFQQDDAEEASRVKIEKDQKVADAATSSNKASSTATPSSTPDLPPRYEADFGSAGPPNEELPKYDHSRAQEAPPEKPSMANEKTPADATSSNPYADVRPKGIPIRPALMEQSEEDARMAAAGMGEREKELHAKERRKGLTREQKEELLAYERERQAIRKERVETLVRKLNERLSVWTESDKARDVTKSFREKTRMQTEELKMESFGLEILHAIGHVYVSKGTNFLKSQKFFGIGGFFGRLKDKGSLAKDMWGTISTAMDAQLSVEELAKMEEKGGDGWNDERRVEAERLMTGKILAAAWRGSKFEIQSVLREVCDEVLNDKNVKPEKRVERAQALVLCGDILKDSHRTEAEQTEYREFEDLMREATKKKTFEKDEKKKRGATAKEANETEHTHETHPVP